MKAELGLATVAALCWACFGYYPPEQIHIALGATPDCITFNYVTLDDPVVTNTSLKWGSTSSPSDWTDMMTVSNGTYLFIDNGTLESTRTIHVITTCGLTASTKYFYQVGDSFYGWSDVYSFTTMPDAMELARMQASNVPQKFVIYGDMGDVNAQTLAMITEEALSGDIDMILHVGDFAYNFDTDNGTVGDRFMNDIEPLAAQVPYMVSLGNHEAAYNFSHYTERFRGMPVGELQNVPNGEVWTYAGKAPNNWYYSWNVGNVHFVSISTEIYFDFPFLAQDQINWLIEDLTIANKNRTLAPWIIVNGHKPLYCTEDGDCGADAKLVRDGFQMDNGTSYLGMEEIFYQFGVDFYICGHEHNYERMYDIYQNKTTKSVSNMPATTYIVTGSAGCQEDHDPFEASEQAWDAFRTQAYSYTRFYVYNSTHIYLEQVVSDNTLPANMSGKAVDSTWYVQENHGPFGQTQEGDEKEGGYASLDVFDVYDNYHEMSVHVNGNMFGMTHAQRRAKERKMKHVERRIEYLGDDKELYRGVAGVHF